MAIIRNMQIIAASREKARLISKELGGKILDRGASAGDKRWIVVYDRVLKLGHRVQVSDHSVRCKDHNVAVMPKSEALSFQAFSESWVPA